MAKKSAHSSHRHLISPLHPSVHFLLFLVGGLMIIISVCFALRYSSWKNATSACAQPQDNEVTVIENVSKNCSQGVEQKVDTKGCKVWSCKSPKAY